jgi:hypothetical protein
MTQNLKNNLAWLKTNPSLDDLCAKFPTEWATVQKDISGIVERGHAEELKHYLEKLASPANLTSILLGKSSKNSDAILSQYIRSHIAHESVKRLCLSTLNSELKTPNGKLRFNFINGFIAQRLLFSSGLVRKPVSLRWFQLLWPLIWQRKKLMPLVQPRGIYCFYSQPFIA